MLNVACSKSVYIFRLIHGENVALNIWTFKEVERAKNIFFFRKMSLNIVNVDRVSNVTEEKYFTSISPSIDNKKFCIHIN